MEHHPLIILGAGIAGMGVASKAKKLGKSFLILEAKPKAGGILYSEQVKEHTLDFGANSAALTPEYARFIEELGLKGELQEATSLSKNRYLWQEEGVVQVVPNPFSFLTASWLTLRGKWALFTEPFKSVGSAEDETVHQFLSRRIGVEATEKLVDPVMAGIYAGDIEKLSARSVLPKLKEGEQLYGSLFKTMMQKGEKPSARTITNFKGGFSTLAQSFENQYASELRLNTKVNSITYRTGNEGVGKWILETDQGFYSCTELVSALPAHRLAALFMEHINVAEHLRQLPYAALQVTHVLEENSRRIHPGFGVLVPSFRRKSIKGVLFTSDVFEGRTKEGNRVMTVFHSPEFEDILSELEEMLGDAESKRQVLRTKNWHAAIPQFELGYVKWKEELLQMLPPHLQLAGNYMGAVGVGQTFASGYNLDL